MILRGEDTAAARPALRGEPGERRRFERGWEIVSPHFRSGPSATGKRKISFGDEESFGQVGALRRQGDVSLVPRCSRASVYVLQVASCQSITKEVASCTPTWVPPEVTHRGRVLLASDTLAIPKSPDELSDLSVADAIDGDEPVSGPWLRGAQPLADAYQGKAPGNENEVNRDHSDQRQQPRCFCREVTSVVFAEIPERKKRAGGTQAHFSTVPGIKQLLAVKTKLTETTVINDSSHVASVEK